MSLATSMLAPLVLLLPAAAAVEPVSEVQTEPDMVELATVPGEGALTTIEVEPAPLTEVAELSIWQLTLHIYRHPVENQVRIERQVTIRIAPRPAPMPPPNMLVELPRQSVPRRQVERSMGNCVPVAGIAGVQANSGNQLMLYMRDQRVVRASLERSCPASSFYQGFYLQRTTDGQLCVNRDTLLSRSGANCKLTRLRQLVPQD